MKIGKVLVCEADQDYVDFTKNFVTIMMPWLGAINDKLIKLVEADLRKNMWSP